MSYKKEKLSLFSNASDASPAAAQEIESVLNSVANKNLKPKIRFTFENHLPLPLLPLRILPV